MTEGINYLLDDLKLWWHDDVESESRHEKVVQLVNQIKLDQKYIDKDNLDHLRLYIKRDYTQDEDGNVRPAGAKAAIGINAVKSAIDTICAKITQQDPRPKFDTDGGRWDQRQRARKLEKFVAGVFYEEDFYYKLRRAFKDAAVCGTGFLKCFFEDKHVKWERVWPGEVIVDEATAMQSEPRSMFQVKLCPVESLIAMFPEYQAKILSSHLTYRIRRDGQTTSLIRVIEAWHLPDCKGKGGRHVICVDGCTLLDEQWDHDFHPFVVFRWNELPTGFYGNGAAEDLAGLQEEIDYIMQRIQTSMHVNAGAWLLKHESDKTPNSHFTNKIGTIIEWSGQFPPELKVNPALHQQVFDHVRWLNELVYNETGVSQMSATSQKPAGVEAAAALQTLLDVESSRFALLQKSYERAVIDAALMAVEIVRKHSHGRTSDYSVKAYNGRFVETINWSDVKMAADEYVLRCWPVNMLPNSPAGKMDTVERMLQAGLVDAQTAMMLLDFPDIEAHQSLALAATRQALWIVDKVIYDGDDVIPRQWYDLGRCIRFMQMGLSNAEIEGAPEETLNRGLEFIAACTELMTPPEPPPSPMEQQAAAGAEAGLAQMTAGMPAPMGPEMMGEMPPDMGAPPMPPEGMPPTPQQGMM